MIKSYLGRLLGARRRKVIAVFAITRAEVECAVRHARAGAVELPVWAWCVENTDPVEGCERFVSGGETARFRRDLRSVWPALSIVAWTGTRRGFALKLLPLTIPPFRAVIFNEACGFFAARPAAIATHVKRRIRDAAISAARRTGEWTRSVVYRAGERTRDAVRLMYSLAYTTGERIRDAFGLIWSLIYRSSERAVDVVLAVCAVLARVTPGMSRRAVARLQDRHPIEARFEPARNSSFVEVNIPGRAWPRRKVLRALLTSKTDFVVFRRTGEYGLAEPLIEVARETNAFAVAKQIAHSAWRKRVIARHPFRRLLAGEVSEVFAPWSPLLVLRRDVFLKFGCPRAVTHGGALSILFWKASAAGLRSLAIGQDGPVTDEPAMPLEDAELAARLTISRTLGRLGPENPQRFRGNVAWSPGHRKEFRGKPRVLIVSPYLPFPLTHGGAVRIYNLCRAMADEIDFVLIGFREAREHVHYDRLHDVFREVYIVDQDEKHRDLSIPKQAGEYRNAAVGDLIRRLCLERRVDVVQLEYTQLAEYRSDTGAVPVLLVEHDITFTLHRQLAELTRDIGVRKEYESWLSFEREALQCSSIVWTMSQYDRSIAVEHGAPRRRTRVVPNGVDLEWYKPRLKLKPPGPPLILFVGSFRHVPNLLAFEALRDRIMPEIWLTYPDALLHVISGPECGLNLPPSDPRIVVEGFVEDLRPVYCNADVAVIPLAVSAGTNIKVIEALACGLAVVSTPAGCRGLDLADGKELLVAELGPAFCCAVGHLLHDPVLRANLGRGGRRTAERRFGWEAIARQAMSSYTGLMTAAPVSGSTNAYRPVGARS